MKHTLKTVRTFVAMMLAVALVAPARAQFKGQRVTAVPGLVMGYSFIDAACLYLGGKFPGEGTATCDFDAVNGRSLPVGKERDYYLNVYVGLQGEFLVWMRSRQDARVAEKAAEEAFQRVRKSEPSLGEFRDAAIAYQNAARVVREIDLRLDVIEAAKADVDDRIRPYVAGASSEFEAAHYIGDGYRYLIASHCAFNKGAVRCGAQTTLPRVIGASPDAVARAGAPKTRLENVMIPSWPPLDERSN